MKELKEIIADIDNILDDAEMYAKESVKHKTQYPSLSSTYCRIAQDNLTHAEMLHKHAVEMIENKKKTGEEAPALMQAVWDFEHERYIDEVADVKRLIEMYKE